MWQSCEVSFVDSADSAPPVPFVCVQFNQTVPLSPVSWFSTLWEHRYSGALGFKARPTITITITIYIYYTISLNITSSKQWQCQRNCSRAMMKTLTANQYQSNVKGIALKHELYVWEVCLIVGQCGHSYHYSYSCHCSNWDSSLQWWTEQTWPLPSVGYDIAFDCSKCWWSSEHVVGVLVLNDWLLTDSMSSAFVAGASWERSRPVPIATRRWTWRGWWKIRILWPVNVNP